MTTATSSVAETALALIPAPAEVQFGAVAEAFVFEATTQIQLGVTAGDDTLFAARQLQSAVHDAAGLMPRIRKTDDRSGDTRRVALLLAGRDGSGDLGFDANLGPEGYELDIDANEIRVVAASEAGLFYAVQTLKQLVRTRGARLAALSIRDRPVLANRGLMLDVSRGKVPTRQTLYALVDRLSEYKYNHLQLYIEHTFDFAHHPEIGAGCDPLTPEDILLLDDYCRTRHVELVPNLQSFGHQRHLLALPRYSQLDEVGWRWSLSPARDETYRILDELYADFLPAFSSKWLNVDCDETWDLATGQSKTLAEEIGKGRVYLRHILRLRELAEKHGRRIMLWADVLHHYPDLVAELPSDVVLLDWEYEARDHYSTTDALGKSGRAFWVCPGTSSWNTLFPRLENALSNIRTFVRDGIAAGGSGMLLTDWGDYGHYQPLSLSWYPYLYGAATAWSGGVTSPEEFDAVFAPVFLGRPTGDASVSAMRRLGQAVTAPTLGLHNRSQLAVALFEDPLSGRASLSADVRALEEVQSAAIHATSAWAPLSDPLLRQDYSFVARLVAFAAAKARTAHEVREALASGSLERLDAAIAALGHATARVAPLRAEFETRWLTHARRSEIGFVLDHFEALARSYGSAIEWLRGQRSRLAAGDTVDAALSSYAPDEWLVLWERGQAEIRKLRELTGASALPELEQG